MPPKIVVGFDRTNKAQIRGKVNHSRTGACTSKGKCYHGTIPHLRAVRAKKSSSSKVGK